MSDDLTRYQSGSTEPWTADLLCALVRALQPKRLLETGGFLGLTTRRLADAMLDGATLTTIEVDKDRWWALYRAFTGVAAVSVVQSEALAWLQQQATGFDFIFLDDDHNVQHVAAELDVILAPQKPLLNPGGLICVHDVVGPFNLAGVVAARHGWVLDLPKLHVAGGLGFIQRKSL